MFKILLILIISFGVVSGYTQTTTSIPPGPVNNDEQEKIIELKAYKMAEDKFYERLYQLIEGDCKNLGLSKERIVLNFFEFYNKLLLINSNYIKKQNCGENSEMSTSKYSPIIKCLFKDKSLRISLESIVGITGNTGLISVEKDKIDKKQMDKMNTFYRDILEEVHGN